MPGWQQIGAVWLPLPHVLNMLPVQVDAWYRTGASGDRDFGRLDGSAARGRSRRSCCAGPDRSPARPRAPRCCWLNPNVLYLQSTPMTEPLLFGTTLLAVALTADWLDRGAPDAGAARRVWRSIAACMTRYEAWPICGRAHRACRASCCCGAAAAGPCVPRRIVARLAVYPAAAIVLFLAEQQVDGRRLVRQRRLLRRRRTSRSASRCSRGIRCARVLYRLSGTLHGLARVRECAARPASRSARSRTARR